MIFGQRALLFQQADLEQAEREASGISNLINFMLALTVLFAVIVVTGEPLTWTALFLPVFIVIETVFLMADVSLQPIASRLVKEIARYGGSIDKFVTRAVAERVAEKLAGPRAGLANRGQTG